MTIKNIIIWFWSTLAVGAVAALVVGSGLEWVTGMELGTWVAILLGGLIYAAISLMGFFCYLIFNWLIRGLFRNPAAHTALQFALLMLVIGNLLYLFYVKYASEGTFLQHVWIILFLLVMGGVIAKLKVRMTNQSAFLPTFFFTVVMTTVEAVPSLNQRAVEMSLGVIWFTIVTIFICNAWQILKLHKWTQSKVKAKVEA
ncbi:KinB-signaling pathway activation protein [Mechercharimyces sp. CAU 1602]|uniref:KinB-signaling pathway activation protein n=1 Tax=Mechercharimyces sp. CAU 1602 TaxID=2973933 RepID=UPI002163BA3B|nr:KinB-signaling pathway activation protein [Mechercharimyces sp. CAU 1602]MCS1352600.1 KinB-signaling pathway activation protein [Mechercharimyces sp. CAU 1602]